MRVVSRPTKHEIKRHESARAELERAHVNAMVTEGFGEPQLDDIMDETYYGPESEEQKRKRIGKFVSQYHKDLREARSERLRTESKLYAFFGWLLLFPIEIIVALLSIILEAASQKIRPSCFEHLNRFNLAELNPDAGRAGARIARFRASA